MVEITLHRVGKNVCEDKSCEKTWIGKEASKINQVETKTLKGMKGDEKGVG